MGLKLLHSADWHLDSPFGGFTEQQRQLLKEEQKIEMNEKIQVLSRERETIKKSQLETKN